MSYIELKNITFGYTKKTPLFNDLSLSFNLGEQVAIIGRNGSGKTTLVKLIIGLLKPIKGQIKISSDNIRSKLIADIATKVGFVFQNPNQMLFANSVKKELELSLQKFNFSKEIKKEKIISILEFFDMVPFLERNPRLLSRGEKQKIALATVLIQEPDAIILDEPFSGIDMTQRLAITNYLSELHKQGKLIIVITHNLDLVVKHSSRIIGLKDGELAFDTTTTKFFLDQHNLSAIDLDQTNYLSLIYSLREDGLPLNIIREYEIINYYKKLKS
jgi:energy-coupling factor transport system ATP-binding protein